PVLLPAVLHRPALVPCAAAHRQLAVRPRAAGDSRERLPRRGDRLSHRRVPHGLERAGRAVRHRGRRAAGNLAALQRPRYLAVLRDHARHAADRGHRRHGHDVRRRDRQRVLRTRAELPAGPDAAGVRGLLGLAAGRSDVLARPLAAVAGAAVRAVGLPLPDRRRRTPARPRAADDRRSRGASVSARASLVRLAHAGAVTTLTLARPAKRNALVPDLLLDLCVALEQIGRRSETRAVVFAAEGVSFSIGGDIGRIASDKHGAALQTYAA